MKFMSAAIGIRRDKIAFQDIDEFVERVVSRFQGARFASPKRDLITGKDAGFVHGCHRVRAVEIAKSDSRRVDGPFRQLRVERNANYAGMRSFADRTGRFLSKQGGGCLGNSGRIPGGREARPLPYVTGQIRVRYAR